MVTTNYTDEYSWHMVLPHLILLGTTLGVLILASLNFRENLISRMGHTFCGFRVRI